MDDLIYHRMRTPIRWIDPDALLVQLEGAGVRDMGVIRLIVNDMASGARVFGQVCNIDTLHASYEMQSPGENKIQREREEMYARGRIAGLLGEQIMQYVKIERFTSPNGDMMRASVKVVNENE